MIFLHRYMWAENHKDIHTQRKVEQWTEIARNKQNWKQKSIFRASLLLLNKQRLFFV